VYDAQLFDAICDACINSLPRWRHQALANLAWALATERHYRPDLMQAVAAAAAAGGMRSFSPTSLTNLAWAFASLQHWDPQLFQAAGVRAAALVAGMDSRAVALLLWAFATFGVRVRAKGSCSSCHQVPRRSLRLAWQPWADSSGLLLLLLLPPPAGP
jgi:hypothetical protein